MLNWLVYAGIGKLLIYLWMKFQLPTKIENIKFIKILHKCGLCSGVWLYTGLALFLQVDMLPLLEIKHIPVFGEFITGCIVSFIVHLISLGWNEQFNVTVV